MEAEILACFQPDQNYSSTQIRDLSGIEEYLPVLETLNALVSKGILTVQGKKRWTRYALANGTVLVVSAPETPAPTPKIETTFKGTRAQIAVQKWLFSSASLTPSHAQEVAKTLSQESDTPLMDIQAAIREGIQTGKIHREFAYSLSGGTFRKISRN